MATAPFSPDFTYVFDGAGGGSLVETAGQPPAPEGDGFTWRHINFEAPEARAALGGIDGVTSDVVEALIAPETRPRCHVTGVGAAAGAFINLRGVNLHEGAEPEDMISIRIWLDRNRIISTWRRPLFALRDVIDGIERGQAPLNPADFVARLALRLADRAEPVVATLNETVDELEEAVLGDGSLSGLRHKLGDVRRTAIVLRRYMFPQRDALSTLAIEDIEWLGERERSRLREATDRITRLAEELDAIRERAAVVHDHVVEQRGEAMNRSMLILAVVAAIFLPLGLLTGLLGINVGGVPGSETAWAFWAVCGLLGVATMFQVWLFRRLRLL